MLKEIIKYANIVRHRYIFEIDGCIVPFSVFKAKFQNDQKYWKNICDKLYKKLK